MRAGQQQLVPNADLREQLAAARALRGQIDVIVHLFGDQ